MTNWQMYCFTMMDAISGIFIGVGIVAGFVCFFFTLEWLIKRECVDDDIFNPKLFWLWIVPFVLITMGSLIPNTKQMAAILIIPKIINNPSVQALPGKVEYLANAWLDELKPHKEEKK
jgi:quinol-cytochrome oxidoreductase complex cytochrome b subunit